MTAWKTRKINDTNDIEKIEYARYASEFDFSGDVSGKTFLITGSGGMTGSAIVKWLLYLNATYGTNVRIYASTRRPDSVPDYVENTDSIRFVKFGSEEAELADIPIDYIIHAASPTERDFFIKYPAETFRVIIDGTERMLELCRIKNATFILLSSVEVYGAHDSELPVAETETGAINSLNIRSGYPLGKKGAEFLTNAYFNEYDCDTRIVRISAIQGLYQPYDEQRIFNEVTRCILEKKDLVMKSDGLSKKSIVYTLDAVSGILTALFKGKKGEAYNITDPATFLTMREFVETVFGEFAPELKIVYDITPEERTGYLPHLSLLQSTEKITALGWRPITDLRKIYEIDLSRWRKTGKE